MALHMSCDIEGCASAERIDGHHDMPAGWSKIYTNKKLSIEELVVMQKAFEEIEPVGSFVSPGLRRPRLMKMHLPEDPPAVSPVQYVACDKHELPKPKEGTGELYYGVGALG